MVTTLSHMASYLAACRASPVIISVFGRLRRKTNTRRREDTKVWYWETMFSQVFSFDFSLHGPLHKYFLYLASAPPPPRRPHGFAYKPTRSSHYRTLGSSCRFTLKDDFERQFWNGAFIDKHNLWPTSYINWWHYGWRLHCKLLYWSEQLSCRWMSDESWRRWAREVTNLPC